MKAPLTLTLLALEADRAEAVGEGAGVEAAHVAALLLRAGFLVHVVGSVLLDTDFGTSVWRFDEARVLHVTTETLMSNVEFFLLFVAV